MPAEEDQFRRVAKNMEDARERENGVKVEKQPGQWNEEDRRAKSRHGSDNFRKQGKQEK
jgi:hypothetical protein